MFWHRKPKVEPVTDRVWQASLACRVRSVEPVRPGRHAGAGSLEGALASLGQSIARDAAEKAAKADVSGLPLWLTAAPIAGTLTAPARISTGGDFVHHD